MMLYCKKYLIKEIQMSKQKGYNYENKQQFEQKF